MEAVSGEPLDLPRVPIEQQLGARGLASMKGVLGQAAVGGRLELVGAELDEADPACEGRLQA
jgi:hypothetical protein